MAETCRNGSWKSFSEFVYADGTNQPPKLLRDVPEQNYLFTGI
jgi:hypothetical protein